MMDDKEVAQAVAALVAWFKSQDIPPSDAVVVMAMATKLAQIVKELRPKP